MSSPRIDFISGSAEHSPDKSERDLSLRYACPVIDSDRETSGVLRRERREPMRDARSGDSSFAEDGLYVPENPFTDRIVKPYRLDDARPLDYATTRPRLRGRLVEIAIRDVRVRDASQEQAAAPTLEIAAVTVLFKRRPVCKTRAPFNRELYRLLIRNSEWHDLSIRVHARNGESSVLPLPLPRTRRVRDHRLEIDFAIGDSAGVAHPGTVVCTVSLSTQGDDDDGSDGDDDGDGWRDRRGNGAYLYRPSNDPNDPHNALCPPRTRRRDSTTTTAERRDDAKYFLLTDPALIFDATQETRGETRRTPRDAPPKPPDVVVTEQPAFSLLDVSFGNLFRANRPLRPSSNNTRRQHHAISRAVLSVTVLRGVEVPVREESALVSPLLEVEWCDAVRTTMVADGPAPVWQQTVHFESPRQSAGGRCERSVKLRLYDQHPVWGQQWLGEARIPLERHRSYQELERWVALSPLYSPAMLFGYVQASPGQSYTRIYVLMKMEQPGGGDDDDDVAGNGAIDVLSRGVQRCLATPYRVTGVETPDDAARLAMLLTPLPAHYGPVTPRQALGVNKVDHYGRAVLLATLLQGFGLQSYVLLGSSQISRWTAFVLSIEGDDVVLWDPEIGDYYQLSDSRCSLMKVSRLIDHSGIWENSQKSVLPHNLRYNVTIGKDWRPLATTSAGGDRSVQTLEPSGTASAGLQDQAQREEEEESAARLEQHLRDGLSGWRAELGLTTVFNRHAVAVLRGFLAAIPHDARRPQFDKRDLKQLYRAYHTHGFLLNLRETAHDRLAELIAATKVHLVTGPVEFALVCRVRRYVGRTRSLWLVLAILRSRG